MTDINSELDRLRAAPELDRAGIFEGICRDFSSGTIAKALTVAPVKKKAKRPVRVDRGGNPLSDR